MTIRSADSLLRTANVLLTLFERVVRVVGPKQAAWIREWKKDYKESKEKYIFNQSERLTKN